MASPDAAGPDGAPPPVPGTDAEVVWPVLPPLPVVDCSTHVPLAADDAGSQDDAGVDEAGSFPPRDPQQECSARCVAESYSPPAEAPCIAACVDDLIWADDRCARAYLSAIVSPPSSCDVDVECAYHPPTPGAPPLWELPACAATLDRAIVAACLATNRQSEGRAPTLERELAYGLRLRTLGHQVAALTDWNVVTIDDALELTAVPGSDLVGLSELANTRDGTLWAYARAATTQLVELDPVEGVLRRQETTLAPWQSLSLTQAPSGLLAGIAPQQLLAFDPVLPSFSLDYSAFAPFSQPPTGVGFDADGHWLLGPYGPATVDFMPPSPTVIAVVSVRSIDVGPRFDPQPSIEIAAPEGTRIRWQVMTTDRAGHIVLLRALEGYDTGLTVLQISRHAPNGDALSTIDVDPSLVLSTTPVVAVGPANELVLLSHRSGERFTLSVLNADGTVRFVHSELGNVLDANMAIDDDGFVLVSASLGNYVRARLIIRPAATYLLRFSL